REVLTFFFQAEDGIRDDLVTGVQTCALPISPARRRKSGTTSSRCRKAVSNIPRRSRSRSRSSSRASSGGRSARRTIAPGKCRPRSEERRVGKECRARWGRNELGKSEEDQR